MSNDLVLHMARAHLAASLLILVVLAVRRPARNLVGARVAYALWLLPLIAVFAALLPPRVDYAMAPPAPTPTPVVQTTAAPALPPAADLVPVTDLVPATAATIDPWQAILVVWALGALVSLCWLIIQQVRYLGFARRGAVGPAVVGFWRPWVVLPVDFEEFYSVQERTLIMAHETTHLRRQDPRVIGVALALRSLAWFNPLAYIAVTKLRIDQELACDEAVVSTFPASRRTYADALAKSQRAIRPLPLGCYWPSGTEHPLLERLSMLKTSHIGTRSRIAGAGALTLFCAGTGLAAWAAQPPVIKVAQASVSTQGAVGAALGAPAQAKVTTTTAPATVKDGRGRLEPSNSAAPIDDAAGAEPPPVTITTNGAPELAARLTNTINGPLNAYLRGLRWPGGQRAPVASGVNHGLVRLTTPDGRIFSVEQFALATFMTGTTAMYGSTTGPTMASRIVADGGDLRIYTAFSLPTGELIAPPPVTVPSTGGAATVDLPGGGSFSITIDGAHSLTAADQADIDRRLSLPRGDQFGATDP